jgi:hypothetical protein
MKSVELTFEVLTEQQGTGQNLEKEPSGSGERRAEMSTITTPIKKGVRR